MLELRFFGTLRIALKPYLNGYSYTLKRRNLSDHCSSPKKHAFQAIAKENPHNEGECKMLY